MEGENESKIRLIASKLLASHFGPARGAELGTW